MGSTCVKTNEWDTIADADTGEEPYQRILDGKGMPDDWATSVVIPNFKGKGGINNCGMHNGVKLLELAKKIVDKVLQKRLRKVATIDDIHRQRKKIKF